MKEEVVTNKTCSTGLSQRLLLLRAFWSLCKATGKNALGAYTTRFTNVPRRSTSSSSKQTDVSIWIFIFSLLQICDENVGAYRITFGSMSKRRLRKIWSRIPCMSKSFAMFFDAFVYLCGCLSSYSSMRWLRERHRLYWHWYAQRMITWPYSSLVWFGFVRNFG